MRLVIAHGESNFSDLFFQKNSQFKIFTARFEFRMKTALNEYKQA